MKNRLSWLLLGMSVICIFLLNYYAIPGHDEMSYAFWGQHTPMNGDINRVSSLMDVVRQQCGDYVKAGGNGRVFTHGIVALFSGFRLYTLFDIINTFVWFLFVWLILREGCVPMESVGTYVMGFAVVWWFLWFAETCSMNAAFALNYLWIACATIVMMRAWRELKSWWIVPLFFIYGWTSEAFVLPMIATLAADAIIRSSVEKRIVVDAKQVCAWVLMIFGACFLCLGPAAQVRATGTLAGGVIISAIKANAGLICLGSPFVLFAGILFVLWMRRKTFFESVFGSLEWWLFLGSSYGLYCLVSGNGVVRLAMPMLLAGVIILLRERSVFKMRKSAGIVFLFVCFGWLVGATALQVNVGRDMQRVLERYRKDAQGITCRKAIATGLFHYSSALLIYNDWHSHLFRREFNHPRNPTVLTPWLYESLYLNPCRFFALSRQLGDSGLYVSARCPKAVVALGHNPLNEKQKAVRDSYFKSLVRTECGWHRFLPGRLKVMFPSEDVFLNIVKDDEFRFTAKDGKAYTLYLPPDKRDD